MILNYRLTIFFVLFISFSVHAKNWEDFLKEQMQQSYEIFDAKFTLCFERREPIDKIDQDWFINLSREEKIVGAGFLQELVNNQCLQPELRQYESDLLAYVAYSGEQQVLDDWLKLRRTPVLHSYQEQIQKLDVTPFLNWYKANPETPPFNMFQFLEHYDEFDNLNF